MQEGVAVVLGEDARVEDDEDDEDDAILLGVDEAADALAESEDRLVERVPRSGNPNQPHGFQALLHST